MYLKRIWTMILISAFAVGARAGAAHLYFDKLPTTLQDGTYNGFLGGSFDNVSYDDLICDDFLPVTQVPSGPWAYEVSTLSGPNPLQYGRFGDAFDAITKYQQAALLMGDGTPALPGLQHVSSAEDITSYQYAIWRLFTPSRNMEGHGATLIHPGTSDLLLSTVGAETF